MSIVIFLNQSPFVMIVALKMKSVFPSIGDPLIASSNLTLLTWQRIIKVG
ncbi:hypothetical protein [Bacillus alveayuensis]|nr:hypothetical protein [Bacillus alveayuensis]